jgi:streptogramin lyase
MRSFLFGKSSFTLLARIGCALIVAAAARSVQAQYVGNRLGGGFADPHGLAVDGSGNVYVADFGNNAIKEIPPGCASSTCVITLGGGFDQPWGVAVDGSGNVFVADTSNNAVKKMPTGCASSSCVTALAGGFSYPTGVAVDGSGNVYVLDDGNGALKRIPPGCASTACVTSLGGGYDTSYLYAVAVSGSGEVYFSDGGEVDEMPSTCMSSGCVTSLGGSSAAGVSGVAVDGSGNVFFSLSGINTVKARPATCLPVPIQCDTALGDDFSSPWGVAVDSIGNVYVPDGKNGTVRQMVGAGLIVGNVGTPVDATTQYAFGVSPGDDVQISGWAAYPQTGGPVSKVAVLIDGTTVGDATLGIAEPTVATNYANISYYEAGWTFTAPTTGLAAGDHKVTAIAYTSLNVPVYLDSEKFTIFGFQFEAPPIGGIDEAVDATTQYTTVAQSDNLYARGWATAVPGGYPLSKVVICVYATCGPHTYNVPLGDATTGFPRPGIAAKYNNSAYLDSGWEFTIPAASLPLGANLIAAYGYYLNGSVGMYAFLGYQLIDVTAAAVNAPPFGALGEAVDATTQTTTVSQSDNLYVRGWAVDPQQGAPVSNVSILIDGTAVGNATVGVARPYIAAQYHNAAYLHSGWTFTMSASVLSAGIHEVTAVATDALGLTKQLGVTVITVTE